MRVTKFKYPLEDNLIKKIDLMIKRCTSKKSKKDSLLLLEGAEGEGKTTFSIAIGYYVADQTKREFGAKNVFFDAEKMIEFAKTTKNQIIVWDEPAFQALATDWASDVVKNITRLLMTARKNRHFFIFNLTKFYKFNEYIVVDRPMGFIHVYSRNNVESGRFVYIKRGNLENLWRDYRVSKKRSYKLYHSKKIRGSFPDILNPDYEYNVLSDFDVDYYEEEKDKAIQSIGEKKQSNQSKKWKHQRNQMIVYIKDKLNLPFTVLSKELRIFGIEDLSMEGVRAAYRSTKLDDSL